MNFHQKNKQTKFPGERKLNFQKFSLEIFFFTEKAKTKTVLELEESILKKNISFSISEYFSKKQKTSEINY